MRALLLAFALGVIALQQQAELPARAGAFWAFVPVVAAVILALWARRLPGVRHQACLWAARLSAALAVALLAFFYAGWRAEVRLADELPAAWEGRDIRLVGVVDELPQPVERGIRFAFVVERALTPDAVVPSRLSLAWYGDWQRASAVEQVPEIHAGERWDIVVRLKRPHGTVNPHGFDVEAWLLENEIRATGYVRKDDGNRRIDVFAGRPGDYVSVARESIRNRILAALRDRPYAGVFAGLAIGDERAIPAVQW